MPDRKSRISGMDEFTEGGDPVCWVSQVCAECGAFVEGDVCARCGTALERADSGGARDS